MTELAGLAWERPFALVLLAVPLVLLLLARRIARLEPRATGTLRLWRLAADANPVHGARGATRIPPALAWLALALALGIIALASPSMRAAALRRSVRVVVDRSPSMYLDDQGSTRLARALDTARPLLARFDDVAWIAPPNELTPSSGREVPSAWSTAPRVPRSEPEFAAWDEPDVLWITDKAPDSAPRSAGYVASGGTEVPGPIGVSGAARVDWDGVHLVRVENAAPLRRCMLLGPAPAPIARIIGAWAGARGIDLGTSSTSSAGELALEVRVIASSPKPEAPFGTRQEVDVARDGWRARGIASGPAPLLEEHAGDGALECWLEDPRTHTPLVTAGLGHIATTLVELDEPRGDPAAFAVSWSRLFDASVLPPRGIVQLSERKSAGPERIVEPHARDGSARGTSPLSVWLAALASAAAIVAAGLAFAPASVRGPGDGRHARPSPRRSSMKSP